ncbi:MAG: hypothetical protein K5925_04570 [Bacilli bacterium]|nr:hypothetical protein [Bacilli bacterium]
MKKYRLEAVIDGKFISFDREFGSRNSAIAYLYGYCDMHFIPEPVINDEYQIDDNKHDIEYMTDYDNRFRVTRIEQ